MPRLLDTAPPHCAGCYDQKPGERHVDMEAAYDGPVIAGADPNHPSTQIDDLVLCEGCIREAARLVGLADWAELQEQIATLTARNDQVEAALLEQTAYAQKLEDAIAAKPKPVARKKQGAKAGASA